MKKLSALPNNTMLLIMDGFDNISVMDKTDFLLSSYFLDYPVTPFPTVCLGVPEIAHFNLQGCIDDLGEEMYEDWSEDVYSSISDKPETAAFLKMLAEVFESHPTYYEGERIEIDMLPDREVKG